MTSLAALRAGYIYSGNESDKAGELSIKSGNEGVNLSYQFDEGG